MSAAALLVLAASAAFASELPLDQANPARLLGRVDAVVDTTGTRTIQEVDAGRAGPWRRLNALEPQGSWNQTVAWYRFTPRRAHGNDGVYAILWPGIIGRVDLYCRRDGGFLHAGGGYDSPLKSLTEHVLVLPEAAYGHPCYLRAITGFFRSSPSIVTLSRALTAETPLSVTFGGFFLAIALLNLTLYFVIHLRTLLIYAGVIGIVLAVLVTDDALWRVVPSTPFVREFVHAFFGWLFFAGTAAFARAFLRLPLYDRTMDRWILALVALSAFGLVTQFSPQQPWWIDDLTIFFIFALLIAVLIAGLRAALRGFRPARYFIIGTAGVCVGVMANLLVMNLQLRVPAIVVNLYEIGIAWETLWLTVALADRMRELARQNVELRYRGAKLRVLAEVDPLTGVGNRRAFDERLQEEWNRALRSRTALGVIMIDVDNFKQYNDNFGHVAGDLCLTKIARASAATLKRSSDFFARYGGEEFAAILVTDSDEDLLAVGEQMRRAVIAEAIPHPMHPGKVVSISVGVARAQPKLGESPAILVQAADAGLYEAKFSGGNKVGPGFWEPPEKTPASAHESGD